MNIQDLEGTSPHQWDALTRILDTIEERELVQAVEEHWHELTLQEQEVFTKTFGDWYNGRTTDKAHEFWLIKYSALIMALLRLKRHRDQKD